MPMYEFERDDGTVFERFFVSSETNHSFAFDSRGAFGRQVWRTAPTMSVPVWHKSNPKESPKDIALLKRAEDPNDYVRFLEPGVDADIERHKKEKNENAERRIAYAVAETIREHDINVPE